MKKSYGVGDVMTLSCPGYSGGQMKVRIIRFLDGPVKRSEIEILNGPRKGQRDIIKSMGN
jgi:hypothetical protein